jgi:hypothetical protein
VTLPEVLRASFRVHDSAPEGGVWSLDEPTLAFLHQHVGAGMRTLETGVGMSTVLFALRGARHTCVVPVPAEVERVRAYCARVGVATDGLTFVVAPSEEALPGLTLRDLDVVLIDGRHGFPAPMIDWYYTAPMLRTGGCLLLDDTQLWPVRMLRDVLVAEPEWQLVCQLPRTAVFRKLADGSERKEWSEQRHVCEATAALARADRRRRRRDTALRLLRRGRLLAIAGAVGRDLVQRLSHRDGAAPRS